MARRKKKILFDVFGDDTGEVEAMSASASSGRGQGWGGGQDVRVSKSFVGVLGLVFVVFLTLSYYLGTIQGANRERSGRPRTDTELQRNISEPGTSSPVSDGRFGVLVLSLDYTKFGQEDARRHLLEAATFLKDQGFTEIDARKIENPKKDGSGRYALWVARGESKDALEPTVKKLRGLLFKSKSAFKSAIALERPKD